MVVRMTAKSVTYLRLGLGLGLGLGSGLGQKTYKNIFHCEKESFTAQTPRKNSMKKIDFKEKSAL